MIDFRDLLFLEAALEVEESSATIIPDTGPHCLQCKVWLDLSEQAYDSIAFRRMCTVQQTLFKCPECGTRLVIYPQGEVPISSSDAEVIVGPPQDGWRIALIKD